jgi:hypothetical protein
VKPQRKTGPLAILGGSCRDCDWGCRVWCSNFNEADPPNLSISPPWHDGCSCYLLNVLGADKLAAMALEFAGPERDEPAS